MHEFDTNLRALSLGVKDHDITNNLSFFDFIVCNATDNGNSAVVELRNARIDTRFESTCIDGLPLSYLARRAGVT